MDLSQPGNLEQQLLRTVSTFQSIVVKDLTKRTINIITTIL